MQQHQPKNTFYKKIILFLILFIPNSILLANSIEKPSILIFVSFSMPKESLKQWISQANHIRAPVIIRGLIDNSFKKTIQKISELMNTNQGGLQIDPDAFEKFEITTVPAVVVTTDQRCLPSQTCRNEYDVIYGDITLEYALNKFIKQSDEFSLIAKNKLKLLMENSHA